MARKPGRRSYAPSWQSVSVLARRDESGPYGPENCYWRPARTEREVRWGVEECPSTAAFEPEKIPLDADQKAKRASLPDDEARSMFDIWARINWRAAQFEGRG